mmetsp:Transcript_93895/g.265229  ORF Transcript_93895/g.265229 Transcript_93895/m.265229 type:complete len:342 (-) Transcript_93895:81-1106(-)
MLTLLRMFMSTLLAVPLVDSVRVRVSGHGFDTSASSSTVVIGATPIPTKDASSENSDGIATPTKALPVVVPVVLKRTGGGVAPVPVASPNSTGGATQTLTHAEGASPEWKANAAPMEGRSLVPGSLNLAGGATPMDALPTNASRTASTKSAKPTEVVHVAPFAPLFMDFALLPEAMPSISPSRNLTDGTMPPTTETVPADTSPSIKGGVAPTGKYPEEVPFSKLCDVLSGVFGRFVKAGLMPREREQAAWLASRTAALVGVVVMGVLVVALLLLLEMVLPESGDPFQRWRVRAAQRTRLLRQAALAIADDESAPDVDHRESMTRPWKLVRKGRLPIASPAA